MGRDNPHVCHSFDELFMTYEARSSSAWMLPVDLWLAQTLTGFGHCHRVNLEGGPAAWVSRTIISSIPFCRFVNDAAAVLVTTMLRQTSCIGAQHLPSRCLCLSCCHRSQHNGRCCLLSCHITPLLMVDPAAPLSCAMACKPSADLRSSAGPAWTPGLIYLQQPSCSADSEAPPADGSEAQ